MNASQEARLSMYNAVKLHCDSNQPILKTNPAFETAYALFTEKMNQLQTLQVVVSKQITGVAKDKDALKTTLCQAAANLAAPIFAFANKTKNQTLKQQVNYSFTDLKRIAGDLLGGTCTNIMQAAEANMASLATYGITPDMVAALQTSINNFNASVAMPQAEKANKKTERANIKTTFTEADDVLKNEMDKLVIGFKNKNPKFVSTYFNVRVIIDPKTGKPKAKPTPATPK